VDILGYIGWPEETADLPSQFGSGKEPCSTSAYIQVLVGFIKAIFLFENTMPINFLSKQT
jgi:hypothetical protein